MSASVDAGIAVGDCHEGEYSTVAYTERLEEVIATHEPDAAAETTTPLFLYGAFQAIHAPLNTPPPELWTPDEEAMLETIDGVCESGHRRTVARIVLSLDRSIWRVLGALDERGFLNDTLVAFAPDNGGCPADGGSNWPLRGTKVGESGFMARRRRSRRMGHDVRYGVSASIDRGKIPRDLCTVRVPSYVCQTVSTTPQSS